MTKSNFANDGRIIILGRGKESTSMLQQMFKKSMEAKKHVKQVAEKSPPKNKKA